MQIGLRLKLFIMTISSMIVISGIILALMILVTTDSTTKFQEELFQDKVTFLAEKYDDWYNHYKRMGESFTRNPVIRSTNLKEIQKWLALELPALQEQDIYINNLIFVEKNGIGTYADGMNRNLLDIDIYAKVLQEGQFRVGNPYVSPSTGKPVVAFYFPVKGSDGDNRLVSMTINLENILSLTTKYMTGTAYAFILDKDGTYLGHPNKDYILKTTLQNLAQENKSDELTAVSTHMLADETGFSVYNFFGVRRMLSYHPIPSLGWKIAVTDKYSALSGKVESQVFSLIVIELAAMILVILISIPFSLRMTHSVKKFSKELELVLGDASVKGDLTKRIGVVSKDEMGQAANYFNHFLQDLREILLITAEEVQRLDERGQELASNMVETASSILQINSNLSSIQHQMEKYYTHIDETNGVVVKISKAIDDSSQQVNVQNDAISQASSAVEEMVANLNSITSNVTNLGNLIQGLNGLSDTGRSRLGQMLESVKTVSDRSAALMNTNKIIDDIASKTNLLAMNAAIEAAHAGLSGRGFAVVADEIRKLAEQSSKQSKEVGVGLNAMTEAIGIIVDNSRVTERALEDILNSIKKVSTLEQEVRLSLTEQNEGSSQILESLERMRETTTQVSGSTTQIQIQRDEITLRMKELKDLATGLEQGLNEISDGTHEINLAVTEVDRLAQENKEGINKVSLSLGQVKLQ